MCIKCLAKGRHTVMYLILINCHYCSAIQGESELKIIVARELESVFSLLDRALSLPCSRSSVFR